MHACDLSRPPIRLARDAVRQPPLSVTSHDPDPPRSKMMEDSAANQQRGNNADLRLLANMANCGAQNQAYPDLGPLSALLGRCVPTVVHRAKLHWATVEPQRIDPGSRPEYSQHCQNAIVPNRKAPEKKKKKPQA